MELAAVYFNSKSYSYLVEIISNISGREWDQKLEEMYFSLRAKKFVAFSIKKTKKPKNQKTKKPKNCLQLFTTVLRWILTRIISHQSELFVELHLYLISYSLIPLLLFSFPFLCFFRSFFKPRNIWNSRWCPVFIFITRFSNWYTSYHSQIAQLLLNLSIFISLFAANRS